MIWNFMTFLETEFPAETIRVNVKGIVSTDTQVPDRITEISETTGVPKPWSEYTEHSIQLKHRALDSPSARSLAWSMYNKIKRRYGQILPEVTVDGEVFPAIQTAQISGNTTPQSLGYDENGRAVFSTNYRIILKQ